MEAVHILEKTSLTFLSPTILMQARSILAQHEVSWPNTTMLMAQTGHPKEDTHIVVIILQSVSQIRRFTSNSKKNDS